jgi:hypothetical protein
MLNKLMKENILGWGGATTAMLEGKEGGRGVAATLGLEEGRCRWCRRCRVQKDENVVGLLRCTITHRCLLHTIVPANPTRCCPSRLVPAHPRSLSLISARCRLSPPLVTVRCRSLSPVHTRCHLSWLVVTRLRSLSPIPACCPAPRPCSLSSLALASLAGLALVLAGLSSPALGGTRSH